LEDNLDDLQEEDCRKVVKDYTERVDDMPELNAVFADACQKFWKKYCQVVCMTLFFKPSVSLL
jgi:truncated hemoglobin YjbI